VHDALLTMVVSTVVIEGRGVGVCGIMKAKRCVSSLFVSEYHRQVMHAIP
jgi:hypothetical protein